VKYKMFIKDMLCWEGKRVIPLQVMLLFPFIFIELFEVSLYLINKSENKPSFKNSFCFFYDEYKY